MFAFDNLRRFWPFKSALIACNVNFHVESLYSCVILCSLLLFGACESIVSPL